MVVATTTMIPLYRQLKDHLDNLIRDGSIKPGEQLPSEKELGEQFKISRITVRRALQELAAEDKIARLPGIGSFVLKPKIEPLTALTSFSENMRAQGYEPSYKDAVVTYIKPAIKIQSQLKVSEEERVLHIHRLMLADGIPMAIQNVYLPERIYGRNSSLFVPEILNRISLYKILELELGITLFRADEWVNSSKANQEEAHLLNIKKDDSVLIIERLTYSSNQPEPVEYVHQIYTASRYRYKVELFRSQKQRQGS